MNLDVASISPAPTEEEAAAITAAITMMWPSPAAPGSDAPAADANRWRFSGRWWANDAVSRRPRPGA